MNVLRFADLVAAGQAAHRRVFIRADLNVPQDHSPEGGGRITEDTRIRASLPCIEMALGAGAAVMVTSHLGRPTEGEPTAQARKMAALCDVFVNDAFGTAHRAEASTYGIAEFAPIACAGPLLAAEIDAITKALAAPKRPLVAIVAGSKVSTKLAILQSLATKVDRLVVGGGIANTFLLAQGVAIGKSLA